MSFAPIETERLALCRLEPADAPALSALTGDWAVVRYTARLPHRFAPAAAAQWIDETRQEMAAGTGFQFACVRRCDGVLIGCAGLALGASRGVAELAYWFGADYWGRGYATEAAARLVRLATQTLGIEQVWAASVADNPASIRVLDKAGLGFSHYGRLRLRADQEPVDAVVHVATAADIGSVRPAGEPAVILVGAVALIDDRDRVLLAQRPDGKSMAGLWEFPGGKVEPGETAAQAAVRELSEELAVEIAADRLIPLTAASHRYPDFHLLMPLFVCRLWAGVPRPHEGQRLVWSRSAALDDYPMPPADRPLIAALREVLVD